MMNEENIEQQKMSAPESEQSANSAAQAEGRTSTGRPRIRRHIPHAEKVSAYTASPYRREQNNAPQRESGYRQREGGYQQRDNTFRTPRYGSSLSQFAPREQRFNHKDNNGGNFREGGYANRDRNYNTGNYNNGNNNYNRRPQHDGGYQRGSFRPRPAQQQGDSFNSVDAEYREGYSRNSYGGGYNNNGGYNNGNYRFGDQQRPSRSGYGNQRPHPQRPRTPGYDPTAKYSQKKVLRYKEANVDPTKPIRLNKFMANAGICSRRDADKYITAGLVTVNGTVVTELGTKVMRTDEVKFHDQSVKLEDKIYILLNKPKDYVTTSDDPLNRKTVMDLVKNACPERVYPIGRLDRNTTGVLLLTNDGDMASRLMHPKYLKKKIYHVYLHKSVAAGDMQKILKA